MMPSIIHDTHLLQLSEFIAEKLGLYYPRERWDDLKRGFFAASQELGFDNAEEGIKWLLSIVPEKVHLQILASHLTIGETYFFRDKELLEALTQHVLPEIIRNQRGREQRLRFWCAGCCSGEEAYTLAILLHQLLPDIQDWKVTITATDINLHFLDKATKGIYGEWSFRNAPVWLKKRYFNASADGHYSILPEIKKLVTFDYLNLVEDVYPLLGNNTNAMDLIFCRNVLMYFSPVQAQRVISNLSKALVEDGWLVVSPSEASKALFPQFTNVNHPGAILFQKDRAAAITKPKPTVTKPAAKFVAPIIEEYVQLELLPHPTSDAFLEQVSSPVKNSLDPSVLSDQLALAQSLYSQGRYAEVVDMLAATIAENASKHSKDLAKNLAVFSLMARALANQGRLKEALECCSRWIAADKVNADGYYMRALILMESGDIKQASSSMQQAIFLRPNFVLAYFSLGNIARSSGKMDEAYKYFSIVKRLLNGHQPNEILPESDSLTVGQLSKIINAMPLIEGVS
ncbi:MAG TPA: CheR family methyltransferase [Methylotenera sp.]|nr:CheR family methyltransferase [Methylotenera sp.]